MHIEVVVGAAARPGQVLPRNQIHHIPTTEEVHYSLFGMDQGIYAHLAAQQSVQSFTGAYSAEFLYLIVRREGDPGGALAAARRLVGRLYDRFALPAGSLLLYYSGGCGFHIGLHQRLFGSFEPGPGLPEQLARLSRQVVAATYGLDVETLELLEAGIQASRPGEHFGDVVPGVCQPGQLLRAPNTRNASTGRYKIPLYAHEVLSLTLAELLRLATQPRPQFTAGASVAAAPVNEALAHLWLGVLGQREPVVPVAEPVPVEPRLFSAARPGRSAQTLAQQARYLVQHSCLEAGHVADLLTVLNRVAWQPLPGSVVANILAQAQRPPAPRVTPGSVMPYQGLPWSGPDPPLPRLRSRPQLEKPFPLLA